MRCVLVLTLVSMAFCQNMTQPAVKRFFKYCTSAALTTATKNLNSARNVTLCNNVCANFAASKDFLPAGTKTTANDPVAKPDGAKTACQKFCAHRASLRKYIDFQFADLGTTYFTANKAAEIKSLFFKIDKSDNNNITKTIPDFMAQALNLVPAAKQTVLTDAVKKNANNFAQKFPADANNVFSYVY